jgi:hypothetical protein
LASGSVQLLGLWFGTWRLLDAFFLIKNGMHFDAFFLEKESNNC